MIGFLQKAMKARARCFGGTAMLILLVTFCYASAIPGSSALRMRVADETDSSNCSPEIPTDVLKSHNPPVQISGEEAHPSNRCSERLQILLGWISAPRRQLSTELSPPLSPSSPSPSPSPSPSSLPSPALSSDFTRLYDDYSADSSESETEIRRKPQKIPRNNDGKRRILIITVALSAAGALILLTVIIIHCCRRRDGTSWSLRRDEKPLLALSSSIFSNGSSSKSLDLKDYSMNRERIGPESPSFQGTGSEDTKTMNFTVQTDSSCSTGILERETPPKPPPPPPPQMPFPAKKSVAPPVPPLPPLKNRSNPFPPPLPKGSNSSRKNAVSGPKTKLKPFFWDKVLTNPDQSMIWNQISSGSFQFNEEMIENLFGYSASKQKSGDDRKAGTFDSPRQIQLLEPKKAQNLAILLRALNVTVEEVRDALMEGSELPAEVLQTLIKMAPTGEEELKLRLYEGELSSLGPAERFLKALVDIPFAFKRMDAMLLMSSMEEEISNVRQDLQTIEAASEELRSSRLFKKLLEAVVKIGNRMNDGTYRGGAQAFKLDTLLKLADVKSSDSSTTLLHFLVHQLVLSEGRRHAPVTPPPSPSTLRRRGLAALSALPSELRNVSAASLLDAAAISGAATSLRRALRETRNFVDGEGSDLGAFCAKVRGYVEEKEEQVAALGEEEKRVAEIVKGTTDFFHGEAGKDEGLRLFVVVREFMGMLERACREVAAEGRSAPSARSGGGGEEWRRRRGEWCTSASEDDEGSP